MQHAQKVGSEWFANFRFQPHQELLNYDAGQKKPSPGEHENACPLCFVQIKTTFDSRGCNISFSHNFPLFLFLNLVKNVFYLWYIWTVRNLSSGSLNMMLYLLFFICSWQ